MGLRSTLLPVLVFLWSIPAAAQVALVPAHHGVYDWLRYQEALGNTEGYDAESLPLSAREIVRHLDRIEAHRDRLASVDRKLLDSYRAEISVAGLEASARENHVRGEESFFPRLLRLYRGDIEPRLVAQSGDGYLFAFDLSRTDPGYRVMRGDPDSEAAHGWWGESRLRSVFHFGDWAGVTVEAANIGVADPGLLTYDPRYAGTFDVAVRGHDDGLFTEALFSVRRGEVQLDMGHGALRVGAGGGPSLILGSTSSTHDWLRLRWDHGHLRYTALVGSLVAGSNVEGRDTIVAGPDTLLTRQAPERWLALHRFTFVPSADLEISVTQGVVYARRGLEWGLSTPLGPSLADEGANGGDNVFWTIDAVGRPLDGLSLHGALLVDPLDPFVGGTALGFDVAALLALRGGWEAEVRRVRLGPSALAGIDSTTALAQRRIPMGTALGPNAEETSVRVAKWLPLRSKVALRYARVRKGLNPVQPGGAVVNVGGDILLPPAGGLSFLEGADVHAHHLLEAEAVAEIFRGIQLGTRAHWRVGTSGARTPGYHSFDVWFSVQSPFVEVFRSLRDPY